MLVALAAVDSILDPKLAPWIQSRQPFDAALLLLAAAVGVAGVAIATLRSQTPLTGGSAKLRKRELVLQEEEAAYRRMWTDGKADPDSQGVPGYLTQKRKDLEADKRRLVRNTGLLHAFIGIGLALLFAQDVYQALAFGAGGPAILASILARQQEKYRLKEKTDALEAVRAQRGRVKAQVDATGKAAKGLVPAAAAVTDPLDQQLRIAADL